MPSDALFSDRIDTLAGAFVVPERPHDVPLASGVLGADGSFLESSRAWIRARKSTPAPTLSPDEPVRDLPGRHLFAGHMRGHFGHFIVESTARLWALDVLGSEIASVLYLPYRGDLAGTRRAIRGQGRFFELMGVAAPIESHAEVLRVETLHVPELGFGWLERYAGSPRYRGFMRERLGAGIAPEGGERLYISRAGLMARRGGILGETVIEENLARAGYEIFRPEKHPLEQQIARYKAARSIVALDGSALHMAAFFFRPGGRVAIVFRRTNANFADYRLQYRSFCGVDPDRIEVIRRDWVSGDARRSDYRSVGELDFAALFARLAELGYVAPDFRPELPSQDEIAAMAGALAERRGEEMQPLEPVARPARRATPAT